MNTIRSFRVPETKKTMANSGIWRDLTEKFGALQDTHGMPGGEWDYTVGSGFGEWKPGGAGRIARIQFETLATEGAGCQPVPLLLRLVVARNCRIRNQCGSKENG